MQAKQQFGLSPPVDQYCFHFGETCYAQGIFFIGFLMDVTYSIPGTADMMDDLKHSQEMSKLLLEGKLEEAAALFSKIEDPNMKDNPSMQVLGVIKENQTSNTNNRTKEVNRENEFTRWVLNRDKK